MEMSYLFMQFFKVTKKKSHFSAKTHQKSGLFANTLCNFTEFL